MVFDHFCFGNLLVASSNHHKDSGPWEVAKQMLGEDAPLECQQTPFPAVPWHGDAESSELYCCTNCTNQLNPSLK